MNDVLKKISHGRLEPLFYILYKLFINLEYRVLTISWYLKGLRKPNQEDIDLVVENVTFIYKSFERQAMAKKLYQNIQKYYPNARVIISDDSFKPLEIKGQNLKIIHLPFNSGLSKGLNAALNEVTTPYVMHMDDDELLTLRSNIADELRFLKQHQEVDLVGFGVLSTPKCEDPKKSSHLYYKQLMQEALKPLKIPHLTKIDETHFVVGKTANIFLARSDKLKEIGWDDNIRILDHNDFFVRAAGNIVSVINPTTAIFHYHNQFDNNYQQYRSDIQKDRDYIRKKYS